MGNWITEKLNVLQFSTSRSAGLQHIVLGYVFRSLDYDLRNVIRDPVIQAVLHGQGALGLWVDTWWKLPMDTVLLVVTHSAQLLCIPSEGFSHKPCHFCQSKALGGWKNESALKKPMKTPWNWLGKNVTLNKCLKKIKEKTHTVFLLNLHSVFWKYRVNSDQIVKFFLVSMKARLFFLQLFKLRLSLVYKQIQILSICYKLAKKLEEQQCLCLFWTIRLHHATNL